jgi:hypothetical protein
VDIHPIPKVNSTSSGDPSGWQECRWNGRGGTCSPIGDGVASICVARVAMEGGLVNGVLVGSVHAKYLTWCHRL